jgi:hypothetical protein
MARHLPRPFRPSLVGGKALAGVCLIRLEQIRPPFAPQFVGIRSENAAHRVAVTWTDRRGRKAAGVYVLRRDTDSFWNHLAGGRLFPGVHRLSRFRVSDDGHRVRLRIDSADGLADFSIDARSTESLPETSVFQTLDEARRFFECGQDGYSASADKSAFEGVRLETDPWILKPLEVDSVTAKYFEDPADFPEGSVAFDSAFVLRDVGHAWRALDPHRASSPDSWV